jgi:hypothetical protein
MASANRYFSADPATVGGLVGVANAVEPESATAGEVGGSTDDVLETPGAPDPAMLGPDPDELGSPVADTDVADDVSEAASGEPVHPVSRTPTSRTIHRFRLVMIMG